MLLISDNGTGYANNHFHVENGQIINNFTGEPVGIYVSSRESNNYMRCDKQYHSLEKKASWWSKLIAWWRLGDSS